MTEEGNENLEIEIEIRHFLRTFVLNEGFEKERNENKQKQKRHRDIFRIQQEHDSRYQRRLGLFDSIRRNFSR